MIIIRYCSVNVFEFTFIKRETENMIVYNLH